MSNLHFIPVHSVARASSTVRFSPETFISGLAYIFYVQLNLQLNLQWTSYEKIAQLYTLFLKLVQLLKTKFLEFFEGTFSRYWDGLLVVWMDRTLFRDEPLIVFIPIYCFLYLTLSITFFRGIAQRLPLSI